MAEKPTVTPVYARVEAAYAASRERLRSDPEYQQLLRAAEAEAITDPLSFLARNRAAIYLELETPWPA